MPEPVTIGYFLEDLNHREFLTALVKRVADESGLLLVHDVRNAAGGKGRALTGLRHFLRDARSGRILCPPVLVVAIDGNCDTYQEKRQQIEQVKEQAGYPGVLVCAVPDPHIERWYLADAQGFRQAIPGSAPPALPTYKCERGCYKQALRQAFATAGLEPQLGGAAYAAELVAQMDLYRAGQSDRALKHFLDDLRAALIVLAPSSQLKGEGATQGRPFS
jgi:hypothetical protein